MTVRDFIEWLKTQDQAAEVDVVVAWASSDYGEVCAEDDPFDPDVHVTRKGTTGRLLLGYLPCRARRLMRRW